MNNWGIASGTYCRDTGEIQIINLDVTCPVLPKGKQVRQNSKDLEAANQLAKGAWAAIKDAKAIFVEVPVGSQSARAMASYGICVGILGSLRANGIPFFEVTPTEVKLAATNKKNATKRQMIDWAMQAHPDAPWPRYKKNGEILVTESKAEHMADAIAAIYAGVSTQMFQQLQLFRA
jgi:Holliday junction resolvasome RuvABC endonuclease subunit